MLEIFPHLEAAITNARNDAFAFSSLSITKGSTNRPPNGSILHLEFIPELKKKKNKRKMNNNIQTVLEGHSFYSPAIFRQSKLLTVEP